MRRVTSVTRKGEAQSFLSVVCKAFDDLRDLENERGSPGSGEGLDERK